MIQFSDLEDYPIRIIGFRVATIIGSKVIITASSKLDEESRGLILDLIDEDEEFFISFGDNVFKVVKTKNIAPHYQEEFWAELDVEEYVA